MTKENKALMELGDEVVVSRAIPAGSDAIIAAGKPLPSPGRGGRAGG
jgi:hypothetical protein